MTIELCGLRLVYECTGKQDAQAPKALLLHGWGANAATLRPVAALLGEKYTVYSLNLPGFGGSDRPDTVWGVEEYGRLVQCFLEHFGLEAPVALGHSFGGAVLIWMAGAAGVPFSKLVLLDSAGVRERKLSWKGKLKRKLLSLAKKIAAGPLFRGKLAPVAERLREKFGSADYRAAEGIMRPILVRILSQDLQAHFPKVTPPTLLVWGDRDTATPLSDAKLMEQAMPNAGLAVLPGGGHYSYLDCAGQFAAVIRHFLL